VMSATLGERADSLVLDERAYLQWMLLPLLEQRMDDPSFVELRRYCRDDPSGVARFQLAARVAALFDDYAVYRPELVLGWEDGGTVPEGEAWQAELWRALVEKRGRDHFARLHAECIDRLRSATRPPPGLPPRVAVFGVASLPRSHLQLLHALATTVDVHLFVPSPSLAWWAEIRSQREQLRSDRRDPAALDVGHPLLASLGALGRDFQGLLESVGDYLEPDTSGYVEPGDATMLAVLQSDLLYLRARGHDPLGRATEPARPIADDDTSITVFSCHSRLREVEVLHDRILDLLAADPTLEPRHIVVQLANVDEYAPLVEAVFERDRDDASFVPYAIADRSARAENPTLEAWLRVLAMVGGRMAASEVLDLLALEPVALRFGFGPDELDTVAEWLGQTGIRWGVDGTHRGQHAQPRLDEATWRFGLRRMLLGYAMPGEGRHGFAGVLPYDEIEGNRAELLGRLIDACERLFALVERLAAPRPWPRWQLELEAAIAELLAPRPAREWELDEMRAAIAACTDAATRAGWDGDVPLPVVRDAVLDALEQRRTRGWANGGVSFCALMPMRAIPARVVFVLGLSDGVFPRPSSGIDFDLLRQRPRAGDRSSRDDDRYAFLEALLCAREKLVLGFVGQSSQDDRDLPPSVVLAELVDLLGDAFFVPGTEHLSPAARVHAVRSRLLVRQPMQPFSPRNFGASADPRLFSYAVDWLDGARVLAGERPSTGATALFTAPLPPLPETEPVRIDRFVRMFQGPAAELLRKRMNVDLREFRRERGDREPMELDGLDEWRIGAELLAHRREGLSGDQSRELLREAGLLPLGAVGEAQLDTLALDVDPIVAALGDAAPGPALPPIEVALDVAGLRLVGHLRNVHARGLAVAHFAKPNARHLVDLWIQHLLLSVLQPGRESVVVGRGEKSGGAVSMTLAPVADPLTHLGALVELWRIGMCEPLPIFPKASLDFCESLRRNPDHLLALQHAAGVFNGRNGERGQDPVIDRVWQGKDPLGRGDVLFGRPVVDRDFMHLSVRVFQPILEH
ncbi:MAG TPA: exodeoxyribonuclease V subunit gamma, partial [Nannocystaceae bacterium]|nr:exodeoxyribonuclease V subunit gamma [Nannocystaceae bacterium]